MVSYWDIMSYSIYETEWSPFMWSAHEHVAHFPDQIYILLLSLPLDSGENLPLTSHVISVKIYLLMKSVSTLGKINTGEKSFTETLHDNVFHNFS